MKISRIVAIALVIIRCALSLRWSPLIKIVSKNPLNIFIHDKIAANSNKTKRCISNRATFHFVAGDPVVSGSRLLPPPEITYIDTLLD